MQFVFQIQHASVLILQTHGHTAVGSSYRSEEKVARVQVLVFAFQDKAHGSVLFIQKAYRSSLLVFIVLEQGFLDHTATGAQSDLYQIVLQYDVLIGTLTVLEEQGSRVQGCFCLFGDGCRLLSFLCCFCLLLGYDFE